MTNKTGTNFKQAIRVTSRLAGGIVLLWGVICYNSAYAETKTVVTEGSSFVCYAREIALDLARVTSRNHAYDECYSLGPNWLFTGNKFPGYEQCFPCGSSGELKCKVTQAVFICTNNQIERDKKAAVEKEAAAEKKANKEKAEKEQADKVHAEKAAAAEKKLNKEKAEKRTS